MTLLAYCGSNFFQGVTHNRTVCAFFLRVGQNFFFCESKTKGEKKKSNVVCLYIAIKDKIFFSGDVMSGLPSISTSTKWATSHWTHTSLREKHSSLKRFLCVFFFNETKRWHIIVSDILIQNPRCVQNWEHVFAKERCLRKIIWY